MFRVSIYEEKGGIGCDLRGYIRGNGGENEKLGSIYSVNEIKWVIKPCAMIHYFKLRKLITLASGCQ